MTHLCLHNNSYFRQVKGPQVVSLWPLVLLHSLSSMSPGPSSLPRQCSFSSQALEPYTHISSWPQVIYTCQAAPSIPPSPTFKVCRPSLSWPLLCFCQHAKQPSSHPTAIFLCNGSQLLAFSTLPLLRALASIQSHPANISFQIWPNQHLDLLCLWCFLRFVFFLRQSLTYSRPSSNLLCI